MGGGWNMWGIDLGVLVTELASTPGLPVRLGHSQLPSPLLGDLDLACNGPLNSSWDFESTLNKSKVNIDPQTCFVPLFLKSGKGPTILNLCKSQKSRTILDISTAPYNSHPSESLCASPSKTFQNSTLLSECAVPSPA